MSCETGFAAQVPDRKPTRHRRKTYCRPNQGLLEDYQFDLGQSMKASKIFFSIILLNEDTARVFVLVTSRVSRPKHLHGRRNARGAQHRGPPRQREVAELGRPRSRRGGRPAWGCAW